MSSINTELYPIGTADNFIQKVVGLFKYSNGFRDFSLSNNPLEMRYAGYPSTHTSVYSEFIGQGYVMNDNRKNFDHFWDYDNGIVGFTYDEGYLDTLNSSVIANMDTLRRNVFDFDNNAMYLYNTDVYRTPVYFPYINSLGDIDYNNDEDRLIRLFKYYTENRNLSLLNGYTSEKYKPNRTVDKKYEYYSINGEEKTYVKSKSKALLYETDVNNDFYANSVDRPSINDYDIHLVSPTASRQDVASTVYSMYNEDNIFDETGGESKTPQGTLVSEVDAVVIFEGKENLTKPNSLVSKTNELFRNGKINSLINRFYIKQNETNELESAVDKIYGLSRGRNLVRGDDGKTYYNGYDDPYCRVWTISNQYSKYSDRIRPFYNNGVRMTVDEFDKKSFMEGLRPFSKEKSLRLRSSMQDNGLPLIAPINNNGNIDETKDIRRCMFSIENLAWRDVNFDAEVTDRKTNAKRGFGKVLSKEQRGPNGGRIMWFPPYNLKFTENVGVNWNSNSFIGRGEQLYTYVNTDRSGTLDFTLLIDHPSILDLYSAGVGEFSSNDNDNDQEILRFFAGCGMLEPVEEKTTIDTKEEKEYEEGTPSADPVPDPLDITIKKTMFAFFPNDFSGADYLKFAPEVPVGYLMTGGTGSTGYENGGSGIMGCITVDEKIAENKNGLLNTWHYEVDDRVSDEVLGSSDNYKDLQSFGLNNANLLTILKSKGESGQTARNILRVGDMEDNEIDETIIPFVDINTLKTAFTASTPIGVIDLLQKGKVKIRCVGFASSHGYNNSNLILAKNRATLLQEYLIDSLKFERSWFKEPETIDANVPVNGKGISSFVAKLGRHAAVYIEASYKDVVPTLNRNNSSNMTITEEATNKTELKGSAVTDTRIFEQTKEVEQKSEYDNEYRYFKEVQDDNDLVRKYITDKVQYFDPAFHSITPEGFNARLTFLHQCTRQGPTVAASDSGATSAGNLAFGRPPVCVLRIGDFYNTRIIIDSISINYDNNGIQWDMNPEGIGLQPMFANVSISFKFIGGSDLSGPISRLQNAVSYNFFANTSVYDRHADYRNAFVDYTSGEDKVNEWQAGINKNFTGNTEENNSIIKK